MKMAAKYGWLVPLIALAALTACESATETVESPAARGTRAYAEVTIGNTVYAETRATQNPYDNWSVYTFGPGDVAGIYTLKGKQKDNDPDDFSDSVMNGEMYYEGQTGTAYRFGNSNIVLDPTIVGSTLNYNYSLMYYPYYKDMPDPMDATMQPGLWLRQMDSGVEKCVDFMYTSSSCISLSSGVLAPYFYHYFTSLVLLRGAGFNAPPTDSHIWVVMKDPFTDIRIRETLNTSGNPTAFTYNIQYNPPADETEDDLMVDIMKMADPETEKTYTVNKYSVWEAWDGSNYNAQAARYAIIPSGKEVFFFLIQDNYGNWQTVSDFYLSAAGNKTGSTSTRYVLTIELEGLKVVVRPVAVENWDDEIEITDIHKVGINTSAEYRRWAEIYNAYTDEANNRSDAYVEQLQAFGDAKRDSSTGEISWTFYINHDIEFDAADFAQINRLDDVLEGTSTYTNYEISNIRNTMVRNMGPNGAIKALNFNDVYLIQQPAGDGEPQPFGALVGTMNGGLVEKCNIINGVLVSENEVGMIAGSVTGGTVRNCTVSGNVIGSSTAEGYGGLFGTAQGNVTTTNNKTGGLKFIEN